MASERKWESRVKEITECSICTEVFTDPRALPCLHTFCFRCIVDIARKKPAEDPHLCPLCRSTFEIPRLGLSGFPKNFYIETLLDTEPECDQSSAAARARISSSVNCDVCTEIGHRPAIRCKATWFCCDCSQNLCENCFACHKRIAATQKHKFAPSSSATESDERAKTRFCERHVQKAVDLWCRACREGVCTICYVSDHNGHSCGVYREPRASRRSRAAEAQASGGREATASVSNSATSVSSTPILASSTGASSSRSTAAAAASTAGASATRSTAAASVGTAAAGAAAASSASSSGLAASAASQASTSTPEQRIDEERLTSFTGHCYRCGWQGHRAADCTEVLTPASSRSASSDQVAESRDSSPDRLARRHAAIEQLVDSIDLEPLRASFRDLRAFLTQRTATTQERVSESESSQSSEPAAAAASPGLRAASPRRPFRCNACGGLGHGSWTCRNKQQCRNCGCYGHTEDDCDRLKRVTKCYECNEMGHVAQDCPTNS